MSIPVNEKWRVEGKDGFDGDAGYYPINEWDNEEDAYKAARRQLAELNRTQPHAGGQAGIQDRIYVVTPGGVRRRVFH